MGYEIKLIVGKSRHSSPELKQGPWKLDKNGKASQLYARDENDNTTETGRTEVYFSVFGIVDLCCPGHDSHLLKLDWKNTASDLICWYYYLGEGDTDIREDCYGDSPKPVPVADVIAALEKDYEESKADYGEDGYRRFKWALAFLKGFDDEPGAEVLLYGY